MSELKRKLLPKKLEPPLKEKKTSSVVENLESDEALLPKYLGATEVILGKYVLVENQISFDNHEVCNLNIIPGVNSKKDCYKCEEIITVQDFYFNEEFGYLNLKLPLHNLSLLQEVDDLLCGKFADYNNAGVEYIWKPSYNKTDDATFLNLKISTYTRGIDREKLTQSLSYDATVLYKIHGTTIYKNRQGQTIVSLQIYVNKINFTNKKI